MRELRGTDGWIASPNPVISLTDSPAYYELVNTMLGHAVEVTKPVRGGVIYPQPRLEEEDLDAHRDADLPGDGVLPGA